METFEEHFNEMVAFIVKNTNATELKGDNRVGDAFDDLSDALRLTRPVIALLAWALNHMGEVVDLDCVASQIDYSPAVVSSSINELLLQRYLVAIDGDDSCLDVTEDTKALIINHYCFYRLLNL